MKPTEKKPETVFRILDRETGSEQGSYSRACCDEYDFVSIKEARSADAHGAFADKVKFKIAKYRVTYELIDDDVDPATPEEFEAARIEVEWRAEQEAKMNAKGITGPFARMDFIIEARFERRLLAAYYKLAKESK